MTDPYVRADVWDLAPDDPVITAYAGAVAAMQARNNNPSDPTSWAFQAAMHGLQNGSPPTPPANQCQHASWYFLPWHRMYLYYFEQVVRAQVIANGGPASWALPYWNYDAGGDASKLPPAFRDPASALYVAQRAPGFNDGTAGLPTGPNGVTSAWQAFDLPTYTGAGEFGGGQTNAPIQFFDQTQTGQLENTPHNAVHDAIGGQSGLMASPLTAAQDPIFWLHHANIDRLWWLWEQQAQNSDPADPNWAGQNFLSMGGFYDASGNPVQAGAVLTCAGVRDTAAQLGYTYDKKVFPTQGPAPVPRVSWPAPWPGPPRVVAGPGAPRSLVGASDGPVRLVGQTVTVPVTIDERVAASLQAPGQPAVQHRVFLDIEHIDAERNPGRVYGIYVNLPSPGRPADADLATHFAGNLSLFGIEAARRPRRDEPPHSLNVSLDITRVLDRLADAGEWTDGRQLAVTFRPTPLRAPPDRPDLAATDHASVPIRIGRVSVHYA